MLSAVSNIDKLNGENQSCGTLLLTLVRKKSQKMDENGHEGSGNNNVKFEAKSVDIY